MISEINHSDAVIYIAIYEQNIFMPTWRKCH